MTSYLIIQKLIYLYSSYPKFKKKPLAYIAKNPFEIT